MADPGDPVWRFPDDYRDVVAAMLERLRREEKQEADGD